MIREIKIFKQTRADGTEYFFAEVLERGKWFFGLFNYSKTYYVYKHDVTPESVWLCDYDGYQHAFKSYDEAIKGANLALKKNKEEKLHGKITSYEQIKTP